MDQGFEDWCATSGFTDAQRAMLSDLAAACRTFNEPVSVTGELADALVAVDRARAVLDGHGAVLTERFDRSGDWAHDAHKSPSSWLLAHTAVSKGRAHGELGRARVLRECPHITEAFVAGRLSSDLVRCLLDVRKPEVLEAFVVDEARLCREVASMRVEAARAHLWSWYWEALERLERNEPDRFRPAGERSTLRTAEVGGRGHLDGDLKNEDLAVVTKAIEDLIATWRRDGELTPDDDRSWDELRADALVELTSRGAAAVNPRSASVIALIDVDTLTGRAGEQESIPFRSDLAGQGPINPDTIRRMACNAAIQPIFHRGGPEVLDVGRTQRLATPAIRRAVYARSGGVCEVCHNARLTWCQIHHIDPWEHGGATSLENSVLVCNHCHHLLHEGRHTLNRTDHGFQLVKPDGTLPRPPREWRPPDRQPPPDPCAG